MGVWGVKIYQDDVTLDVRDEYKDKLHRGKTKEEALEEILEDNQETIEDEEESPLFWIALADTQWNLGRLDEHVKEEALKHMEKDLARWKEDEELCEKRRKVLEALKKKLLSPQPEEKKISKYRLYKNEWKIGDVFAYKIEGEEAIKNNLNNRYFIIQKVDETEWWPGHIIPVVRVKITQDENIPKTEGEIDKLEYIQMFFCPYEERFRGRRGDIPLKDQIGGRTFETDEYGQLPEFLLDIIITTKSNAFEKKLIYIGNYPNIKPPKIEYIPFTKYNITSIRWKDIEEHVIDAYLGFNKRGYEMYHRK